MRSVVRRPWYVIPLLVACAPSPVGTVTPELVGATLLASTRLTKVYRIDMRGETADKAAVCFVAEGAYGPAISCVR